MRCRIYSPAELRELDELERARDLKIIWTCDQCGHTREDPPGFNEGGSCHCGGTYQNAGESYRA